MICAFIENLLDLYLDGRLVTVQSRWVEHHLKTCPACAAKVASLRSITDGLRALPVLPPPDLPNIIRNAVAAVPTPKVTSSDIGRELSLAGTPSLALAFGLLAFILSFSSSLLGPGIPSQVCGDGTQGVCRTALAKDRR